MVKLLRCVADITKSNTEIKARFDEPLIIEPNSKIALLNLRARFPEMESEGSFTIIAGQNDTLSVDNQATTIPDGEYFVSGGPQGFEDILETYISKDCGSAGGAWNLKTLGTDYRVSFGVGKFQLTKTAAAVSTALWEEDLGQWFIDAGNPDLSTSGTFISDAGASTSNPDIIFSVFHIPNASFNCTATVSAVDTNPNKQWELGAFSQSPIYAIGMNGSGNYGFKHFSTDNIGTFQPFTGGTLAPTTTPQANDRISILRQGDEVVYQVRRGSTIILEAVGVVTEANQRQVNAYVSGASPVAYVNSRNNGLTLTSCQFTILEPTLSNKLRTVATPVRISFGSLGLARYLGFPGLGPYTEFGDPAVIVSPNLLAPDEQAIGTIVTVDPLVLESYDGDIRPTTKKGRDSILAVLNQVGSLGKTFVLDVNFPVSLGIRNASRQTVNQLNFRFKDQSNGETLQFDKDTFLTVLIYGPTESP